MASLGAEVMKPNPMLLRALMQVLPQFTYQYGNETQLHKGMSTVLTGAGIAFKHEHVAGPKDRFDFLCDSGIVIEAKVKGSMSPALIQCARYLDRDDVSAVVLVTTRYWGGSGALLHRTKAGKEIHVIQIKGASF